MIYPQPFLEGVLRGALVGAISLFVGLIVAQIMGPVLGLEPFWGMLAGFGVMLLIFATFRPIDG